VILDFYLKTNLRIDIMKVDQQWVEDNIDIVSKIFNRLNREESSANKSNHKRKMKEDMDRVIYRGYYELARKQEKERVNKAKTIGDNLERIRMNEVIECNASNTKQAISNTDEAIDLLDDQLKEKDKIIKVFSNQITEKDKQISEIMKQIAEKDKQINKLIESFNTISRT
jgi:chromosome segregation ATPase